MSAARLKALLCLCAGCVAAPAMPAAPEGASNFAPTAAQMTKERAVRIVRGRFDGRILSAGAARRDGERGFDVRVLTEGGRIKNVFVNRRGAVSED